MGTSFTIARLAAAAEVHVETIRYYQRRGLLAEPDRIMGAIRRYAQADLDRLRFIKRAQSVGFTLKEIAILLALRNQVRCSETRALAATKLAMIDRRLRELRRLRTDLSQWIADCDANAADDYCPVIERLETRAG